MCAIRALKMLSCSCMLTYLKEYLKKSATIVQAFRKLITLDDQGVESEWSDVYTTLVARKFRNLFSRMANHAV